MVPNPTPVMPPLVTVAVGSAADWPGVMDECCKTLEDFGVPYEKCERRVVADGALVIIATGDLAGELAAHSVAPVLAVPMGGLESLQAAVQSSAATLAIGKAGAINAALLAVAILANNDAGLREKLVQFRAEQTAKVLAARVDL